MIRVNLLPQRRAQRASAQAPSQRWLVVVIVLVLVEAVGLVLFHQTKTDELSQVQARNQQQTSKIGEITKLVSNHEEIKQSLAGCKAREDAIKRLQAGRAGPTAVLLELSQVLTSGKAPTADAERLAQIKKINPLATFNPGWDPKRLWLTLYKENDRQVRVEGLARDNVDVYELAQRLRLSVYFYDVEPLEGKKQEDKDTKIELVSFALKTKVRY